MAEKRKLSYFHIAQRKKLSRRERPGCKISFSARHFDQHVVDNFKNSKWLCLKSKSRSSDTIFDAPSNENFSTSCDDFTSDDKLSFYRVSDVFTTYFKKNVPNSCTSDSDSEDEIWDSITMEDLDLDLQMGSEFDTNEVNVPNQNLKIGTLLIWFCIFLCSW